MLKKNYFLWYTVKRLILWKKNAKLILIHKDTVNNSNSSTPTKPDHAERPFQRTMKKSQKSDTKIAFLLKSNL